MFFTISYALADCADNVAGFTNAYTNFTFFVANHDDGTEAEFFTTLNYFTYPTDLDNPFLVSDFLFFLFTSTAAAASVAAASVAVASVAAVASAATAAATAATATTATTTAAATLLLFLCHNLIFG